MSSVTALLPLLALLVLRGIGLRFRPGIVVLPRWVDALLVVGLGGAGGVAAAGWYAPVHIIGGDWIYHDFPDYCSVVAALAGGVDPPHSSRSLFVGRIVSALTPPGRVFDGMVFGGWAGALLLMVALAAWARVVAGRAAAIVAVVVALAVGPLVLLTRTPTFYPLMDGVFALAAAAAALAFRDGRWPMVALAATLAGVCGMADARGVTFAAWFGGAAALAAVLGPVRRVWRPWGAARGLAVVGLCGLATWGLGRSVHRVDQCAYLEPQVLAFVNVVAERLAGPEATLKSYPVVCPPRRGFCWGWSEPRDLPVTVACVSEILEALPPHLDLVAVDLHHARRTHLDPWLPVLLTAGLFSAVSLRRRPRALVALLVPAVPFLSSWEFVGRTEIDPRRLAPVLLFVPVVVGVASAAILGRGAAGGQRRWGVALGAGAAACWILVVSGTVPTWWAPQAGWRLPWIANAEHAGLRVGKMVDTGSGRPACSTALAPGPEDLSWDGVLGRLRPE